MFDQKAYLREYQEKNREKIKAQRKTYYENNKDRILVAQREKYRKNSGRYNLNRAFKRVDASPDLYMILYRAQAGRCAICKEVDPKQYNSDRFNVDHDHKTGKIRGLLCSLCNRALGMYRDNPEFLESAAQYLRERR